MQGFGHGQHLRGEVAGNHLGPGPSKSERGMAGAGGDVENLPALERSGQLGSLARKRCAPSRAIHHGFGGDASSEVRRPPSSLQAVGSSATAMSSLTMSPGMKGMRPHCRVVDQSGATRFSHNRPGR